MIAFGIPKFNGPFLLLSLVSLFWGKSVSWFTSHISRRKGVNGLPHRNICECSGMILTSPGKQQRPNNQAEIITTQLEKVTSNNGHVSSELVGIVEMEFGAYRRNYSDGRESDE
jgi:hypothetical protein